MNSPYIEAVKLLGEKDAMGVEDLFERLKSFSDNWKIIINIIKNECFLPINLFKEILNHFIELGKNPINELQIGMGKIIRKDYLLKGKAIEFNPLIIGSTYIKDRVVTDLMNENDELTDEFANKFLSNLLNDPKKIDDQEKLYLLKGKESLTWVTWDEFNNEDPFFYLQDVNTKSLHCSLALNDDYKKEELLIVYFNGPMKSALIHKPTWCDSNFFEKFFPPENETRWGQTKPTDSIVNIFKNGYNERRPEGVLLSQELNAFYIERVISFLPIQDEQNESK